MIKKEIIISLFAGLAFAGCGQKEPEPAAPPIAMPTLKGDELGAQKKPTDPGEAAGYAPLPPEIPRAAAPAVEIPPASGGPPMEAQAVIAALEKAVEYYQRMRFAIVQEENNQPWPELTDLSLLVRVGVLKGLPQAPFGKKFVLDQKTGKVSLVDA